MTRSEVIDRVMAGEFLAVGEFRLFRAEQIQWRGDDGKPQNGVVLRHTVEFGAESVAVSEFARDGVKLEDVRVLFKKGELVVLHVTDFTRNKGSVTCRGKLEKLLPEAVPAGGASAVKPGAVR